MKKGIQHLAHYTHNDGRRYTWRISFPFRLNVGDIIPSSMMGEIDGIESNLDLQVKKIVVIPIPDYRIVVFLDEAIPQIT